VDLTDIEVITTISQAPTSMAAAGSGAARNQARAGRRSMLASSLDDARAWWFRRAWPVTRAAVGLRDHLGGRPDDIDGQRVWKAVLRVVRVWKAVLRVVHELIRRNRRPGERVN
jgi:hypothetical protein